MRLGNAPRHVLRAARSAALYLCLAVSLGPSCLFHYSERQRERCYAASACAPRESALAVLRAEQRADEEDSEVHSHGCVEITSVDTGPVTRDGECCYLVSETCEEAYPSDLF